MRPGPGPGLDPGTDGDWDPGRDPAAATLTAVGGHAGR